MRISLNTIITTTTITTGNGA
ncbi:thr operon leader peptide, partial [Atlantibacter hermannii]